MNVSSTAISDEAVQAAAKAMYEPATGRKWVHASPTRRANWIVDAADAVAAALPHIREQIAAEIEQRSIAEVHTTRGAGYNLGISDAAALARGLS